MANEYPELKTSASGHAECRSSCLGGWTGWHWTVHACKGGLQCLIRLQAPKNKTSGHTETICFWRIIDFHRKWIDAQRRRKQGTYVQACVLKASHNVPYLCPLLEQQQYGKLTIAMLTVLLCDKYRNTSDIYHDRVIGINAKTQDIGQNWTSRARCHTILIQSYIVCIRYGAVLTS